MVTMFPKIELIFFDAGGGHRSAANALKESMAISHPGWDVTLVNLQEMMMPSDPVYFITGVPSEQVYNGALKRGWTYGSKPFLRALQGGIQLYAAPMEKVLRQHWRGSRPDMVVSVIPNFNRIMFNALQTVHPHVPYVTVMTDIADSPPNFWMEDQDQYVICGSRKAAMQAHLSGYYRPERIFETSGMILRPAFYEGLQDPALTHAQLGLDPGRRTAVIMFGGNGSKASVRIADHLGAAKVQSIILCGKNKKLLDSLQGRKGCHAVGFTDRVADYMNLADFFIGKPGPGSISEALRMGLPVIVESNARTMVQERYNVTWVEEQGVGIGVRKFSEIGRAVRYLCAGDRLDMFRQNALRLNNRAVFEIPGLLERIMEENTVPARMAA
jgi:UDP-N-acetylglucosamine:LPS N-acetylglucosamine transferase